MTITFMSKIEFNGSFTNSPGIIVDNLNFIGLDGFDKRTIKLGDEVHILHPSR
jgi:hypothetical protein